MKTKKGFTLVELLAVIAILSLLVIIALPNIMSLFNEAKKNSFITECKQIFKTAQQQWMNDSMFDTNEYEYSRCKTCTGKSLALNGRQEIDYYVKVNKAGKIVKMYVTDGTYQYVIDEEIEITDIDDAQRIAELTEEDIIKITTAGPSSGKTYRFITNVGSFSETQDIREIMANVVDDGYVFTYLSAYELTTGYQNRALVSVADIKKFKSSSFVRVYSDSSKSNLLAEITYNDVPKRRFSLSTGKAIGLDTYYVISKRLGDVNLDNIYIEKSSDICFAGSCSDSQMILITSYYGEEMVTTYSGPWITEPSAVNSFETLERSLSGMSLKLTGFVKCTSSECGDKDYIATTEAGVS